MVLPSTMLIATAAPLIHSCSTYFNTELAAPQLQLLKFTTQLL